MIPLGSIEVIKISGGSFLMGAVEGDRFHKRHELPQQDVEVKDFYLSRFPITEKQFSEVMLSTRNDTSLPVVNVSWFQTQEYCAHLSKKEGYSVRLPTEQEWEYVYRAGSEDVFPSGEPPLLEEGNYLYDLKGNQIGKGYRTPVETYALNPWGVGDLLGNIAEWTDSQWTADLHPETRPASPLKVVRGAGWDSIPPLLRCSHRDYASPVDARDNLGFRIVVEG